METKNIEHQGTVIEQATEALRQHLNEVIKQYKLPPELVLPMLARIAAGYTHMWQRQVDSPQVKDSIEESFIENYNLFLYDFDQYDINAEIEKMKTENMN